jgi:hypothetical protein
VRRQIFINLDPDRFELSTFRLSSERSNQLSYGSSKAYMREQINAPDSLSILIF